MSLELLRTEVGRFLSTKEPEVLCVKGRWGVGKTFGWRRFLADAKKADAVALRCYSYVSLFGLNSLNDLRFRVFESTTTGDRIGSSPDDATFGDLVGKGSDFARRLKPMVDVVSSLLNRKGATDLLFQSAFLAVKDQIVCLDDLERAGRGLSARDVLGFASFLKEERRCKIVLLLNDEEHDERGEFEKHLEKVADVRLAFDPTPEEAAAIALVEIDRATALVKPLVVKLGITNIRVIKKIERLAKRLVAILEEVDVGIVEQAVATLVLASWSVQQPSEAPPLDFLKSYNAVAIAMRAGREKLDEETRRHRAQIADYPFDGPDDVGLLMIEAAAAGFFKAEEVREASEALERRLEAGRGAAAFTRAWDELYHGSLTVDDDTFLDALRESSIAEAGAISLVNVNAAVRMLREFGRPGQADEVVNGWFEAREGSSLDSVEGARRQLGRDDELDEGLRNALAARRRAFVDTRDPLALLKSIGERSSWNPADAALLAKRSTDDFVRLFESLEGDDLRRAIDVVMAMGKGTGSEADAIRVASVAALRQIGRKSPIRARKVASYGIGPEKASDRAVPDGEASSADQR